ncbi:MAG: thermonuclease family protein [Rhodospirillales bacterium]|nr:thermonuclease family protein [Rhodospirillales bacterium]
MTFFKLFFFLIALAAMPTPAAAREAVPGPVEARVIKVIDGDTFFVSARIWPGLDIRRSIRPRGFDAPEIRGKCPSEKRRALAAREYLKKLIGRLVILSAITPGKYAGRVIATVKTQDGKDVAVEMIAAGHARPYDGKKRKGWCPE